MKTKSKRTLALLLAAALLAGVLPRGSGIKSRAAEQPVLQNPRIRAYRMDGTQKAYGAWSKTAKIKIKK